MNQKTKEKNSTKTSNLRELESIGVDVPFFKVFDAKNYDLGTFNVIFRNWLYSNISEGYGGRFSVRSSGSISTPGRMQTILDVPSDLEKLLKAGQRVHKSSDSSSVRTYLKLKGVTDFTLQIIVQAMVYGNKNEFDCSGVLVTRHPIKGTDELYGEITFNALGEDLMAGKQTPSDLSELGKKNPRGYNNLMIQVSRIKNHYQSPQEIEFVIEDGHAWILQTRKYHGVTPFPICFPIEDFITSGVPATPISAIGKITYHKNLIKEDSIYVSEYTDWEDTQDMIKARGIITIKGGALSHAAIIAREFRLPCVTGVRTSKDVLVEGMTVGMDINGGIYKMNNV